MSELTYCLILSQEKVALVDRDDHWRASRFKWSAVKTKAGFYAAHAVNGKLQYLHQFLLDAQPGDEIDHRDRDGLNCRRLNLRMATRGRNSQNRRKMTRAGQSEFKGVYRSSPGRWGARITADGKITSLGTFPTELEAARAYDAAALRLHGEFARLNFSEASI